MGRIFVAFLEYLNFTKQAWKLLGFKRKLEIHFASMLFLWI